jgi:hypothetical protein
MKKNVESDKLLALNKPVRCRLNQLNPKVKATNEHSEGKCMMTWEIEDRFQYWCRNSEILRKIHPKLCIYSRGLAQIDKMLIFEANEFSSRILCRIQKNTNDNPIDDPIKMGEHIILSEFWVFGAYEFLRTLDELCSKNPSLFTTAQNKVIKDLKHHFEHIRIPLAKLQPAARYNTDYSVVDAGFSCNGVSDGVSWKVSDEVTISRCDLSDKIFNLLENLNET